MEELVCLSLDSESVAPEAITLFAWGKTDYTNAENQPDHYVFLEADADALMAEFDRRGIDAMIDYNHQQLRAKSNGQPAPAAGWVTALEKGGEGLVARVSWTDRAKDYIANKEYRYTSPLFYKDKLTNRITRLINVALTNIPGTDRQQALVSLELSAAECDIAALPETANSKSTVPENNNLKGGETMNKKLFELVGLEMPADDGQQAVALEAAITGLVGENSTLKAENAQLKSDADAAKKNEETVALEAAIAGGLTKGKLDNVGADKLRSKPLAEVLTVLELIPENAVVPLNRTEKTEGKQDQQVALSADDIAYCNQHGYDQAEFAAAKKTK